jgi:hypothetical protein
MANQGKSSVAERDVSEATLPLRVGITSFRGPRKRHHFSLFAFFTLVGDHVDPQKDLRLSASAFAFRRTIGARCYFPQRIPSQRLLSTS